jgi:excisionase family DNA binding protein
MKNWLTVTDVAVKCMVSTATVRRWIKDGKLFAIKLPGRHYRIRSEDYRDFLKRYNIAVQEEFSESEYEGKEVI